MRTRRGGNTWWNKLRGSLKKPTFFANPTSPRHVQLETKVAALDAEVQHFKQLLRKKLLAYGRKVNDAPESEIAAMLHALRIEVETHKGFIDALVVQNTKNNKILDELRHEIIAIKEALNR